MVETVLDHKKPNNKSRKDYEFLIKWYGYDNTHNTWEPWVNVKNNELVNEYLYDNKLKSLLTKTQKEEVEAHKIANQHL